MQTYGMLCIHGKHSHISCNQGSLPCLVLHSAVWSQMVVSKEESKAVKNAVQYGVGDGKGVKDSVAESGASAQHGSDDKVMICTCTQRLTVTGV